MATIFETFLLLPLFQGMTIDNMTHLFGKVKFHFEKMPAGGEIARAGTPCRKLTYIIKGSVEQCTKAADGARYEVFDYCAAPYLIEPYSLFGLHPSYRSSYKAETDIDLVSIDKRSVLNEFFKHQVFCINMMNIVSARAQVMHNRLWNAPQHSGRENLLGFFASRFETAAGRKAVRITLPDLASVAGCPTAFAGKWIEEMERRGLLEYDGGNTIRIPDLAQLEVSDPA